MPDEVGKVIMAGNTPMEFVTPTSKRRTIRTVKNPLDKCTIVSIFPMPIEEVKPTIEPGKFILEPGTFDNPSVLVIGPSSWWKDYDYEQPLLEIPVGSMMVANSVITDYCNGMLGCDMSTAMPGLFFTVGEHNSLEIKMRYKERLSEMKEKQDNWYKILVRLADSLWARTSGNPLAIWDEMRLAARELNFNDKPWLKDFQTAELTRCKFCGGMRNPQYPICPSCKAIDMEHPLASEIKFAAV